MKRTVIILLSIIFVNFFSFSQMAVIDANNIATAINNGITAAKELQATYENLKMKKEQIEREIKQLHNLSSLENLSLNPIENHKILVQYTNRLMNIQRDLGATLKNKTMSVAGVNFSLLDLVNTNVYKKIKESSERLHDPNKMTKADREKFYMQYGMSYENFLRLDALAEQIDQSMAEEMLFYDEVDRVKADIQKRLLDMENARNESGKEFTQKQQEEYEFWQQQLKDIEQEYLKRAELARIKREATERLHENLLKEQAEKNNNAMNELNKAKLNEMFQVDENASEVNLGAGNFVDQNGVVRNQNGSIQGFLMEVKKDNYGNTQIKMSDRKDIYTRTMGK